MDHSIERIAAFVTALRYEDLTPQAVVACRLRVTDSLGCALGAWQSEPATIARELAERATVRQGACVIGSAQQTLPELAAFANGVMIRYLDGNDTFPGGGGHPSDVIAPMLAVAQHARADGCHLLAAITVAYEVYQAFFRGGIMREKGLDHVFYTAVAAAAGSAKLLGLGAQRTRQALVLAITPNIALHATRRGDLSMWKGVAAPNAARNGVFAALLAQRGMTGPEHAVEGSHGLRELLGTFDLPALPSAGGPYAVQNSNLKYFLSEYHSQSPIAHALELSREVECDDIAKITIHTYWFAWSEIGSEPEKWHPTTRESADHSLPFIVAAVFRERSFSDAIFGEDRLRDPAIHAMAEKVEVREEPAFTRDFPGRIRCRVDVTLKDGRTLTRESEYPRGHVKNPMTENEVSEKFRTLAARVLTPVAVDSVLGCLARIDTWPTVDGLFEALRISAVAR